MLAVLEPTEMKDVFDGTGRDEGKRINCSLFVRRAKTVEIWTRFTTCWRTYGRARPDAWCQLFNRRHERPIFEIRKIFSSHEEYNVRPRESTASVMILQLLTTYLSNFRPIFLDRLPKLASLYSLIAHLVFCYLSRMNFHHFFAVKP